MQWQRPEAEAHLPEPMLSEVHDFLFKEDEDRGGFPAEETWDKFVIWKADDVDCCCLLSVSPVNEDMYELLLLLLPEYEKLMVVDEFFRGGGICWIGVA